MIDPDIHLAKALLVEGNPLLRTVTATQLRDAGVGQVSTAGGVKYARLLLERERFDIVVCSREFEEKGDSGQDLLDELRRENQLPHSTVFIMVSAQAVYHQIMEAGESALDGILVRPYTTAQLCKRLYDARHRKRELGPVLQALDAGDTETALTRALRRFQQGQPFAAYCGRLAAELMMKLNRHDDARLIFEKLRLQGDPAWARLGVARAELAGGNLRAARAGIQAVLANEPQCAAAHDLLGRIMVELCEFDAALDHYRSAADLTPGCLLRAQHAGALAFYQGQAELASTWLERSLMLGIESKLFDALTLLLVALLRLDAGNRTGVAALLKQVQQFRQRYPESVRLQRFEVAGAVLLSLADAQPQAAHASLCELSGQAGSDDFDLEAANLLAALWSRMPRSGPLDTEHAHVLEQVAMRFCVSKIIAEMLVASARRDPAAEAIIRQCQSRIATLAERAMTQALSGDPAAAVHQLMQAGEHHLNARLLELAGLMARRHAAVVPDAEALAERAAARMRQSCRAATHIAGIQRSGRSPGGLQLRGRSSHPELAHGTA